VHAVLLVIHIAAGGTGLLLAWPVLFAPKRRGLHPLLGRCYAVAAVTLCLTAFSLVWYDPARLAGLAVLGVLTLAWVTTGVLFARRRPALTGPFTRRMGGPGTWRIWHLNLMSSSVISFVTAFAVQVTGGWLAAWLLPTIVGSPLIAMRTRREVAMILQTRRVPALLAPVDHSVEHSGV
jgi:hypothetical protein